MNSGSAVKRRREGALERLKKSAGKDNEKATKEIKALEERIKDGSKHRKYLGRTAKVPQAAMQSAPEQQ
jgi:hypothetical protein